MAQAERRLALEAAMPGAGPSHHPSSAESWGKTSSPCTRRQDLGLA